MSMESIPPSQGKIFWLSGPSSSGKTTAISYLDKHAWEHIEADALRALAEVSFLSKALSDDFESFKTHFSDKTPMNILGAVYGQVKPDKKSANFDAIQSRLLEALKTRQNEVEQVALIMMLDKAVKIAAKGKNVILDHVLFINDTILDSKEVTRKLDSPNLWVYRNFEIEQQLKYVSVDTLMRNVIRRNQNACAVKNSDDYRPMPMVLGDYSKFFVAFDPKKALDQENLGKMKVDNLKKWIARAMKIAFFDINPHYVFKSDPNASEEQLDKAIEKRLDEFIKDMNTPNPIDPEEVKVDEENIRKLEEKKVEYGSDPKLKLQEEIDAQTKKILEKMNIPPDVEEVNLTYVSTSKCEPTVLYTAVKTKATIVEG